MGKVSCLSGLTGSWFRVCPVSDFEFSGFQGSDLEFSVCSFRFPVFGFACGLCPSYVGQPPSFARGAQKSDFAG